MNNSRPCTTCCNHMLRYMASHREHRPRCKRPQTMSDGRVVVAGQNGFDALIERDGFPEPQRQAGDKCGISGKWWAPDT